jgi:hypothetical protein
MGPFRGRIGLTASNQLLKKPAHALLEPAMFHACFLSSIVFLLAALACAPPEVTAAQIPEPQSPAAHTSVGPSAATQPNAAGGKSPLLTGDDRIRAVLAEPSSFDFQETPLAEVARKLGEKHGVTFGLDIAALTADGKGEETPITYKFEHGALKSGLRQFLDPRDLAYVVENEQILITTKTAAETKDSIRVYKVTDLVSGLNDPTRGDSEFESLIELITWTIAVESWREDLLIKGYRTGRTAVLVISQTEHVHDQIAELLASIRKIRDGELARFIAPAADAGDPAPKGRVLHASEAERRIYEALEARLTFASSPISLTELAAHLRATLDVPVELDDAALTADEIDANAKSMYPGSDQKLHSALTAMLNNFKMTYVVRFGTLLFTTKQAAPTLSHLRVYRVEELVYGESDPGTVDPDFEPLIERIQDACGPGSWREHGASPGEIRGYEGQGVAVLAVRQTPEVHLQIAALLDLLHAARNPQSTASEGRLAGRALPPPPRLAPGKVVYGLAPGEETIRRALKSPARLERRSWKLAELVAAIRERHKIAVDIGIRELEADGKDGESVVRTADGDGTLDEVLTFALDREGLATIVRNEQLEITTKTAVEMHMPVRVYQVHDLLLSYPTPRGMRGDYESLLEILSTFIAPDTWRESGYGGLSRSFEGAGSQALVMDHTEPVYRDVDQLLSMLRAAYVPQLHATQLRRPVPQVAYPGGGGGLGGGMF